MLILHPNVFSVIKLIFLFPANIVFSQERFIAMLVVNSYSLDELFKHQFVNNKYIYSFISLKNTPLFLLRFKEKINEPYQSLYGERRITLTYSSCSPEFTALELKVDITIL